MGTEAFINEAAHENAMKTIDNFLVTVGGFVRLNT
jgi:hypothetical protein